MRLTVRFLVLILLLLSGLSGCSSIGSAMKASPSLANATGFADIPMPYLEERYVNGQSRFMDVNGYHIHYRDQGKGDTIILLHGIFSALQTWDGWVDELSRTHRVITLDMPGYGMTGAPENPDDFDEANIVNTFAKFVERLDLDTFTLAGNSLGGFVAASYAAQYANRVDRLVLLDPFGYPQDTPWILSLGTSFPIQFLGQYVQPPVIITMTLRWAYGDPRRMKEKDVRRYVQMSQRPGARPIYMKTLEMVEERAENNAPLPFYRITAPTLLMWGEDDDWVPVDLAQRWLDDLPNVRLVTYPGVGHIPMEEVPEDTLKDLERFLSQGLDPFPGTLAEARHSMDDEAHSGG
ncbi:alpha/beta hydrolase [Marinobacter halodurans]|uniref:Alpha/beta hydrolase n=1 Tax=Marinobacter halodurans TaxID=2528979 RepID=A0ABY1ZJ40_9GAMM|nr:alpha/beta hydrolase [Marinobacter halodurans]TBW54764.1 alpha/beta hydrolase [Marinobacter halodurans]